MLKDRTAIITGSTSGIGLGIAETLAAAGATVMLNGFGDPAQIEKIRRDLAERHGISVAYSGADLSKPAEVRGMVFGNGLRGDEPADLGTHRSVNCFPLSVST